MKLLEFSSLPELNKGNVYYLKIPTDGDRNEVLKKLIEGELDRDASGRIVSNRGGWQSQSKGFDADFNGPAAYKPVAMVLERLRAESYYHFWFNVNYRDHSNAIHNHSYQLWRSWRLSTKFNLLAKWLCNACRLVRGPIKDSFWSADVLRQRPEGAGNINFYRCHPVGALLSRFKATQRLAKRIWKPCLSVAPQPDKIYVFHCTRFHSVDPNSSNEPRISIAVDFS